MCSLPLKRPVALSASSSVVSLNLVGYENDGEGGDDSCWRKVVRHKRRPGKVECLKGV